MRINSNFLPSYSPTTTSFLCSATFTSVTEAGGQLPALWPSTVSPAVRRQCKPTHTHFHTHTQRRSLGCPGWTGAEVLQKGPGGKRRSFGSGTRVILAVPNLTGWMIIPAVPTHHWICTSERKERRTVRNTKADKKTERLIGDTPLTSAVLKTMCSFIISSSFHPVHFSHRN